MADVRKLRVAAETKPKPNADIAALLRKLGELNEGGKLAGLIVCSELIDGYDWDWIGTDIATGIGLMEAGKVLMLEDMLTD